MVQNIFIASNYLKHLFYIYVNYYTFQFNIKNKKQQM